MIDIKQHGTTTVGIITEAEVDPMKRVLRRLGITAKKGPGEWLETIERFMHLDKLIIDDKFVGVAKLHEADTYDLDTGKKISVEKAKKKYDKAVDNAIKDWQIAMIKEIHRANPDTFAEAMTKAGIL